MFNLNPRTKYYDNWIKTFPDGSDKVVAITGTTTGTGYWAAVASIRKDVKALILLNRNSPRNDEAMTKFEEEKKNAGSKTILMPVNCDLMSFESVKKAAKEVNEKVAELGGLNVLACNAGIMGFPDDRTVDGYDLQIQVNHLSQYLLVKEVMPALKQAYDRKQEVRVIFQSSTARNSSGKMLDAKYFEKSAPCELGGHETDACFQRYHQSKLANSTFPLAFHDKIIEQGLDESRFKSVGAEPGWSVTGLGGNLLKGHDNTSLWNRIKMRIGSIFIIFRLLYAAQSAADGSLSILEAMFGKDVNNGDLIHPENTQTGNPIKMVSKGKIVDGHLIDEKLTLDKENQNLIWKKSVEECGDIFAAFS